MVIDRSYFVQFQGRDFVLFGGLLDAATRAGLRSIVTAPVQIASAENGWMAVMKAKVEFEDGRVFEAIGDASPQSCGRMIHPHVQRMAETRAVGRAFRWALNVAATMKEELGDAEELPDEERQDSNGHGRPAAAPEARPARAPGPAAGRVGPAGMCAWPECEVLLTKNQATLSKHHAQMPLCPDHLAEFRRQKAQAQP